MGGSSGAPLSLRGAIRMASLSGLPCGRLPAFTAGRKAQAVCRLEGLIFQTRCASSASSRWKSRQGSDPYAREAKLKGMKSRAAFKLSEVCYEPLLFLFSCSHMLCFPLKGIARYKDTGIESVANLSG